MFVEVREGLLGGCEAALRDLERAARDGHDDLELLHEFLGLGVEDAEDAVHEVAERSRERVAPGRDDGFGTVECGAPDAADLVDARLDLVELRERDRLVAEQLVEGLDSLLSLLADGAFDEVLADGLADARGDDLETLFVALICLRLAGRLALSLSGAAGPRMPPEETPCFSACASLSRTSRALGAFPNTVGSVSLLVIAKWTWLTLPAASPFVMNPRIWPFLTLSPSLTFRSLLRWV